MLSPLWTLAQTTTYQGFDAAATNNWSYATTPAPYNFPSPTNDVWKDTTYIGTVATGNTPITLAPQGTKFWGMWDLENPATTSLGAPFYHYMDFAPIATGTFSSNTISFKYFTHLLNGAGDSLAYQIAYDNGATWTGTYTALPANHTYWDSVTITAPANAQYVRIRFRARINGGDDWAGIDAVKLVSSNVDLVPPSITSIRVTGPATIRISFNEMVNVTAENTANYTGVPGLQTAVRNASRDTVTLTYSPAFPIGVYDTLFIANVQDSAANPLAGTVQFPFVFNNSTPSLVIAEIMYHGATADEDSTDFLEIYNAGSTPAILGGLVLNTGADFRFPQQTLAPGGFALLSGNAAKTAAFYNKPFLTYNDLLGNGGELLTIRNSVGTLIDSVNYDDAAPWPLGPPSPDGDGPSLELITPLLDNSLASSWQTATTIVDTVGGGMVVRATPGAFPSNAIPTLGFLGGGASFDEAADTVSIGLRIQNRNPVTTGVRIALVAGFGTATNVADYQLLTDSLTFSTGTPDTMFVKVRILNDAVAEAAEYFALRITNASNGAAGGAASTTLFIRDNDLAVPQPRRNITLSHLGSYRVADSTGSAEILAYDSLSNRLFVVNSLRNKLHILSFANPGALTAIDSVNFASYGGGINSVAARRGIVAIAVEDSVKTNNGKVVFLDTNGAFLKQVSAGALPDMVTFTSDGRYVLTANEGEPNDLYTIDPEGSVTVVDLQNGVANATATTALFTAFNGQETALRAQGVRIFGPNATVSKDVEPEYVTVAGDSAYVALQEANALAVMHIPTATITRIMALGYSDHMQAGNGFDASDNNGNEVLIANWPVRGMYMPDAIASYSVGGQTYVVTANEGDARDYDPLEEEVRVGAATYPLDATAFPHASLLKSSFNLGRLTVTSKMGDTDNDGDFDQIYVFGGRSFSILNPATGAMVYNSGDRFEHITRVDPKVGKLFNADNGNNSKKNRSDNKGPEPEGVTMATINDTTYAFIALERTGGVMAFDVTNPTAPVFVQYINTRDTATFGGDNGAEGIIFIPADSARGRKAHVLTANEISATVAVFEVDAYVPVPNSVQPLAMKRFRVYPNPVHEGRLFFSEPVSGMLTDITGRTVRVFREANSISTASLLPGTYLLRAPGYQTSKVVIE